MAHTDVSQPIGVTLSLGSDVINEGLKLLLSRFPHFRVSDGDKGPPGDPAAKVLVFDGSLPINRLPDFDPTTSVVIHRLPNPDVVIHWSRAGVLNQFSLDDTAEEIRRTLESAARGLRHMSYEIVGHISEPDNVVVAVVELTNRGEEVIRELSLGLSTVEIATVLSISKRTVDFHIHNILSKTDSQSRVEAVAKCIGTQRTSA